MGEGLMMSILTSAAGAVAGQVVSSALGGKKNNAAAPMLMEAPGAATQDNTRNAADDARLQQRKRDAGATGRSDTIKTGSGGNVGELGTGNREQKTLLGY